MIEDFALARDGLRVAADVCLVGGGAAGITIAHRLAGSGLRVCLLESGALELEAATQDLYRGAAVGAPRLPLDETRLRYFGGSTNHWDGQCAPLEADDLEPRDWIPHSGWPLRWEELRGYYARAAGLCHLPLSGSGEALWREVLGRRPPFEPGELESRILQLGPPVRFGETYRERLAEASDLRVLLHANATRLVADASGRRVRAVELRTLGGKRGRVEAARTVLCCGAIENARLLLVSGLGNDLVGRFFMDHVRADVATLLATGDPPVAALYGNLRTRAGRFRSILTLGPAARRRAQVLGCGIHLWPRRDAPEEGLLESVRRGAEGLVARLGGGPPPEERALMLIAEQAPSPESRVTLSAERDALGLPRVRVAWRLGELERRTLEVTLRTLAGALGRRDAGRVRVAPWFGARDGGWTRRIRDYNHHMGTTRMSDTPATGVVDPSGRVHGMDDLYVAGSSVFPTSGCLNPTLTLVALALRLADRLRRGHGAGAA